jgi:hypothetical protein
MRKSKDIEVLSAKALSEDDYKVVVREKSDTWDLTQQLHAAEQKLNLLRPIQFHLLQWLCLAAVSAILQNLRWDNLSGGCLLLVQIISIIYNWIRDFYWASPHIYSRLLAEIRDKA